MDEFDLSTMAGRLSFAMSRRGPKGTNPNQIEARTGVFRQTLYQILAGVNANLSSPNLVKVCDDLGIRPQWLTDGDEPMIAQPILKEEEIDLVVHYRQLSHTHQKDILDLAEKWAGDDDDGDGNRPGTRSPPPHRRQ